MSPAKLIADAAAAFEAAEAAAAAAAATSVPQFTLGDEEEEEDAAEEPSGEGSEEEELQIDVVGEAVEGDPVAPGEGEEPEANDACDEAGADKALDGEPEAGDEAAAVGDGSGSDAAGPTSKEPLEEPDERSLTVSVADTVDQEGAEQEGAPDEEAAAAATPEHAALEQPPPQLLQSPISPLSDVDTEVPLGDDQGASDAVQEAQEGPPAAGEGDGGGDLPTPLKAHRIGEDLHAHPVEGKLLPSPEKRPQSGQEEENGGSVPDDGHLIA